MISTSIYFSPIHILGKSSTHQILYFIVEPDLNLLMTQQMKTTMTYSFETGCELPKNFWTCGSTNCRSIWGSGDPKPCSSSFRSLWDGGSSGWLKHVDSDSLRRLEACTEKASSVFLFFSQSHLSKASNPNLLSISKFKTFLDNWITSMLNKSRLGHELGLGKHVIYLTHLTLVHGIFKVFPSFHNL